MLIENQNRLNEVGIESNSTQNFETVTGKSKRKQSIHKTDEIKCFNRYETLYRDGNDDESGHSCDGRTSSESSISSQEISREILLGNIHKKKNWEFSTKRKDKNTIIKGALTQI